MPSRKASRTKRARRRSVAQGARAAAYRDLVLEAAEASFAARGVEATKMEEIGEQAGLSLGTVYSVFDGGKAAIVDALHEKHMRELLERSIIAAEWLGRNLRPWAQVRVSTLPAPPGRNPSI